MKNGKPRFEIVPVAEVLEKMSVIEVVKKAATPTRKQEAVSSPSRLGKTPACRRP
jgi:hypothetical protein